MSNKDELVSILGMKENEVYLREESENHYRIVNETLYYSHDQQKTWDKCEHKYIVNAPSFKRLPKKVEVVRYVSNEHLRMIKEFSAANIYMQDTEKGSCRNKIAITIEE